MYCKDADYYSNYLLFSEKHLCNELDFGETFFRKVCAQEIKNIDKRLNDVDVESQKQLLISIKHMLEQRQQYSKQAIIETIKDDPIELLCSNEAMCQLDGDIATCHEFLYNISEEERYKLLSSKLGTIKIRLSKILNDSLFELDIMQYLCGLNFVRKDSSKLNKQKRILLQQVRNGYKVDYQTDTMQKALQKIKSRATIC